MYILKRLQHLLYTIDNAYVMIELLANVIHVCFPRHFTVSHTMTSAMFFPTVARHAVLTPACPDPLAVSRVAASPVLATCSTWTTCSAPAPPRRQVAPSCPPRSRPSPTARHLPPRTVPSCHHL